MLDLRRLVLLRQFALRGTIAGAASALGYSPSAVSQQLSVLEREAGVALLDRTARTADLTDAGRFLADRAGDLLASAEAIESALETYGSGVRGTLAVCTIPSTAATVAAALAAVAEAHPDLDTSLRQVASRDARATLRVGDADLAVVDSWSAPPKVADLVRTTLVRDELRLAVPPGHPLAAESSPITVRSVREYARRSAWLCAPEGEPSRAATDVLLRRAGVAPTRVWEFQGLETLAALVAQGAGIAVLPESVVRDTAAHTRPLRPARHRTVVAVRRRAAAQRPAVRAALAALREAF